MSARDMVNG